MINFPKEAFIAAIHSSEWRKKFRKTDFKDYDFENEGHKWFFTRGINLVGSDELTFEFLLSLAESDPKIQENDDKFEAVENDLLQAFREIQVRESKNQPIIYPDTAENCAKEIQNKRLVKTYLSKVIGKLEEKGTVDEVIEEIIKGSKRLVEKARKGEKNYTIVQPLENFKERNELRKEKVKHGRRMVFEGLEVYQDLFPLGIFEKESLMICADTGVGKSILLLNFVPIAISAPNSLNGVVFFTENEETQNETRFDSIYTEVPYDEIYLGDLSEHQVQEIHNTYEKLFNDPDTGKLFFVKLVPYDFTAETLSMIIDEIEEKHDVEIDWFMIDSPEHQLSVEDEKDLYRRKARACYDNKKLRSERSLIEFSTVQRKVDHNGLFAKKKKNSNQHELTAPVPEEAAGTAEIPRTTDFMIIMDRPFGADKFYGRNKGWLVKARGSAPFNDPFFIFRDSKTLKINLKPFTIDAESDPKKLEELKGAQNSFPKLDEKIILESV